MHRSIGIRGLSVVTIWATAAMAGAAPAGKGADYEVAVREYPADAGDPDAVNGHILHSKVFTHDGTVANASGSFESQYLGNVATFTVELAELHASRGTLVKTLFMVGQCGPVAQTLRLGAAAPTPRKRR